MSILIDENTKVIVQGITGRDGAFHTRQMKEYGTKIVGGVTPGKGGQEVEGVPVFNSVEEAVKNTGADASIIFVPAGFANDALFEALFAGIKLIVCVTEGVPTLDALRAVAFARSRGLRIIGPNCPGVISPGKAKLGIMPAGAFKKGCVGIVSRSGTLTYEIAANTGEFGQSTVVGIGGDPVIGTNFIDCLQMFQDDPQTKAIVIVGEIGGSDEEQAAEFVKNYVTKPVFGFIAGQTAPPDKRMGHAGAIISAGAGTAQEKIQAFASAGIEVFYEPEQLTEKLKDKLT